MTLRCCRVDELELDISNMQHPYTSLACCRVSSASKMASSGQQQLTTQLDHLTARYEGTGHADMTRHEWAEHQHRDSIASYLGHSSMVDYFAMAEGVSVGRARLNLLERMHRPIGEPPAADAAPPADRAKKPAPKPTGTVDRAYP